MLSAISLSQHPHLDTPCLLCRSLFAIENSTTSYCAGMSLDSASQRAVCVRLGKASVTTEQGCVAPGIWIICGSVDPRPLLIRQAGLTRSPQPTAHSPRPATALLHHLAGGWQTGLPLSTLTGFASSIRGRRSNSPTKQKRQGYAGQFCALPVHIGFLRFPIFHGQIIELHFNWLHHTRLTSLTV